MIGRARAMPQVGGEVTVLYLGASSRGIVQQIADGGRRLLVLTEEGETLTFVLSRATGRFATAGTPPTAQLVFGASPR